jgi:hypothetical protein
VFVFLATNFRTVATQKKSLPIEQKGFYGGKKHTQKSPHFEGKKRLEVAVFRQCVHQVGRQNYAGFLKTFANLWLFIVFCNFVMLLK